MKKLFLRLCLHAGLLALSGLFSLHAVAMAVDAEAQAAAADQTIPSGHLLQPAELAQILQSTAAEKPLVLQVGSAVLYAQAHIPGADYAGPAGQDAGLQALKERVKSVGHDQFIVIYCGCCPWDKCPNIRRAYQQLVSLGFTHVKAVYIANDFGTDWVAKGYPVVKGH
jgi:hypothetical protein